MHGGRRLAVIVAASCATAVAIPACAGPPHPADRPEDGRYVIVCEVASACDARARQRCPSGHHVVDTAVYELGGHDVPAYITPGWDETDKQLAPRASRVVELTIVCDQ